MRSVRTTRCCTTLALIVAFGTILLRSQGASFFPARTRWSLNLGRPLSAPPLVTGTHAFLPLTDHQLSAIDLSTGRQTWIADTDVRSRPAAGDARVFVVDGTGLIALSVADGSLAWRLPIETLGPELAAADEWIVAVTTDGTVVGIRAADGHLAWKRDIGARLHAPPSLAAGRAYLPLDDGRIVSLIAATGDIAWERRIGDKPNDVLVLNDRLYAGSLDNYFYCLDAREGKVEWRWRTGGDVVGLPLADERRVYFVSRDNVLRALDLRSGTQQWRRALPIRPTRGPVRLLDMIVVSGSGSTAQAYSAKNGQPAGAIPTEGAIAASPHVFRQGDARPSIVIVTDDLIKGASVFAIGSQEKDAVAPAVGVSDRLTAMPTPARSVWRR